jgi:hypothetical protein
MRAHPSAHFGSIASAENIGRRTQAELGFEKAEVKYSKRRFRWKSDIHCR